MPIYDLFEFLGFAPYMTSNISATPKGTSLRGNTSCDLSIDLISYVIPDIWLFDQNSRWPTRHD